MRELVFVKGRHKHQNKKGFNHKASGDHVNIVFVRRISIVMSMVNDIKD